MALSQLEHAKYLAIADTDGDGKVSPEEMEDNLGLNSSKKSISRTDYQKFYDERPDLQDYWNRKGGVWSNKYIQSRGAEKGKIEGEIAGGIGKIGNLSEEFQGIETEGGKECAKENMGGKAMSEAGFGCWAFWNEVYRHGRTDGSGILTPTGTNLTNEQVKAAINSTELTKAQKRKMMMLRWDDMGFNKFNNVIDNVKIATSGLYGKSIDDDAAAILVAANPDSVSKLITEFGKFRKGETYDVTGIELTGLVDNGDSFSMDSNLENLDFYKATTPYSFDQSSRYYGDSEIQNGKRVETESYWSGADAPGWVSHEKFGTINQGTGDRDGWNYSLSMGWFYQDEENSPDWFWSEKAGTWMYPHQTDKGMFFWAKEQGEDPDSGEWVYPDMNTGKFYDYDTGTYMDASQVKSGEIFLEPDSDTGNATPPASDTGNPPASDTGNPPASDTGSPSDTTNPGDMNNTQPNTDQPLLGEDGNPVPDWYRDELGAYFSSPESPNWKMYTGNDYNGWWYDDPDSKWNWSEDTGWMWNDPSIDKNWFFSNRTQSWAYAKGEGTSTKWLNEDGSTVEFPAGAPNEENEGAPPVEPGTNIPKRISYDDDGAFYDPDQVLTQKRKQLNEIARDLSYEGWDQGLIMGFLKKTEVYKDLMDWATGREDVAAAEGLVDDIVEQVAEVNARKGNIATNLDMFDARGAAMLDPRMTLEEKLAIRAAKPSRAATQSDVDAGLAEEVGQIIRNPDYDENLSYYFEYLNPETGELETRAFRPDMPGKQTFMQEQERLIDGSKKVINQQLDDLLNPLDEYEGKSKYQAAVDKQMDALRAKGIIAGGVDDPNTEEDESLGLYAREGMNALNYIYGDDKDSQQGMMEDYNEMKGSLRDQQNYLGAMDAQRDLDISSKLRNAMEDLDPVERARDRAMDRVRLARFGGGVVGADNGIREQGGLFEKQLDPKLEFKDLSKVTGLGDTYTQKEIDVAGIGDGLDNMPQPSDELKQNQFYKNINPLGKTAPQEESDNYTIDTTKIKLAPESDYNGPVMTISPIEEMTSEEYAQYQRDNGINPATGKPFVTKVDPEIIEPEEAAAQEAPPAKTPPVYRS